MVIPHFDGFWHWLGWFLIVAVVAGALARCIRIKL